MGILRLLLSLVAITLGAAETPTTGTRYRGVVFPPVFREQDFRDLVPSRANLVRWQIRDERPGIPDSLDGAAYDAWLAGELDEVAQALEACRRHGFALVIDLHAPIGGRRAGGDLALLYDVRLRDAFVRQWTTIATRFRGHPALWAYGLVNEPGQLQPTTPDLDYLATQERAARAIRAVDPTSTILVAAKMADGPEGFVDLRPIPVAGVAYEVHLYVPMAFTHQGVEGDTVGVRYPGIIAGHQADRAALRRVLEPVRRFQTIHGVRIYVGEFSAVRWAPGAAAYLTDCIALFEEFGWDWTYHAYREWPGWSLEPGVHHLRRPDGSAYPADDPGRLEAVLRGFARNPPRTP